MNLRPPQPGDRARLSEIFRAVGNFNPVEVDIAIELVDDVLQNGPASDYISFVLETDGSLCGYVCFGRTPLTDSTFDFYWLAVDPAYQGRGIGRHLVQFVEEEVKRRRGTMLVLETSSTEAYARTVRMYERSGYQLIARIPHFYRHNDDKLIYIKTF